MKKVAEQVILQNIGKKSYDSTLRSNVYDSACAALLNKDTETLEACLEKAANLGLVDDIKEFAKKAGAYKTELVESNYALVTGKEKLMPLRDEKEVQASLAYFDKYHTKFPVEWREDIADKLVKAASWYKLPLNVTTLAYTASKDAKLDNIDKFQACHNIAKRAEYVRDASSKVLYDKTGETIGRADLTVEQLLKFAHMIEKLDRKNRITDKVNSPIADILVQKPILKEAGIKLINKEYDAEKIASADKGLLKQALGDNIAKALEDSEGNICIKKVATIIPTLPRGEKEVLEKHLEAR